ncbi:MAG: helix-turn-helix domain-containing protein [Pseudomonadota bacterium]
MLKAALELVLEVGTQKTTLKEIGERAGYSRGLAQAKFGSKDQLFVRLADDCRRLWLREIRRHGDGKFGLDALMSRLDATVSFADNSADETRVMYTLWFESVGSHSEIRTSLARFHRQARDDIQTLALAGGLFKGDHAAAQAEGFAVRFCGTIFGMCYQWIVAPDAINLRDAAADLRRDMAKLYASK